MFDKLQHAFSDEGREQRQEDKKDRQQAKLRGMELDEYREYREANLARMDEEDAKEKAAFPAVSYRLPADLVIDHGVRVSTGKESGHHNVRSMALSLFNEAYPGDPEGNRLLARRMAAYVAHVTGDEALIPQDDAQLTIEGGTITLEGFYSNKHGMLIEKHVKQEADREASREQARQREEVEERDRIQAEKELQEALGQESEKKGEWVQSVERAFNDKGLFMVMMDEKLGDDLYRVTLTPNLTVEGPEDHVAHANVETFTFEVDRSKGVDQWTGQQGVELDGTSLDDVVAYVKEAEDNREPGETRMKGYPL